jgi:FkbM family methyltransferase
MNTLTAHARSYRMYEYRDETAGIAARKVTRLMRAGRAYEQPLLEHIFNRRFRGTAIDVGANVGNHALWLASICKLRVVAFEPIEHAALRANVALNYLDEWIDVHPYALGAEAGWARHTGAGVLEFVKQDPPIPVGLDIPVHRLDDYGLEDVAVIKADVEGMEVPVLRGGEETIRRWKPVIYAEEWDSDTRWHDMLQGLLGPWGYRMTRLFRAPDVGTPIGQWEHTG